VFVEPQQGATYEQQRAMAQAAEEAGFDAFFRSDHFLTMGGSGLPGPTDAWTTLGALARETSRIRLGTLLTSATFRFPGVLAVQVAQVDRMSGGRVELGLGAGWYEDEHRAYGVPFAPIKERFERLAEQLEIIDGLWTTGAGSAYEHAGRHYRIEKSPGLPKPLQDPRPPLIVGGYGARRTPALAARFADEFNLPFADPATTAAQFDRVRRACEQRDRDPASLVYSIAIVTCCGTDEAEISRRASRIGRDVDELRTNGAAGTPPEVAEKLATYRALGAGRAYLQLLDIDDVDHARLVAREVMPALS
jgi:F420-dependent oxidoreductase-like protein